MSQKKHASQASSSEQQDKKNKLTDLSKIKTLDFGDSAGFVCDAETGICGPVNQEKEGK